VLEIKYTEQVEDFLSHYTGIALPRIAVVKDETFPGGKESTGRAERDSRASTAEPAIPVLDIPKVGMN
jgi:hypothetical protein